MNLECCVVVPIYKSKLNRTEQLVLEQANRKLPSYGKCFIAPRDLKTELYVQQFRDFSIIRFDSWKRDSLGDYNRLMMKPEFYLHFEYYRYILLFQLDGMILQDERALKNFIQDEYDYIGAPWPGGYHYRKRTIRGSGHIPFLHKLQGETDCYVGNGGVSLRKIDSMVRFWRSWQREAQQWNNAEDIFISFYGQKRKGRLRIAPPEIAAEFSLEKNMREEIDAGRIPFAVHKWERYYPQLLEEWTQNDNCQTIGRLGQSNVPICNDEVAAKQISGNRN